MGRLVTRNNTARFRAEENSLVLDGPMGYYFVVPKEGISEIRQATGRLWKWSWPLKNGISIYHSVSDVPQKLVFRSCDVSAEHMLNKLKILKYNVL